MQNGKLKIKLLLLLSLLIALPGVSNAIPYTWEFELGGIFENDFVVDDIFKKLLDGEVDILVEQDGVDFSIDSSTIEFEYSYPINKLPYYNITSTVLSTDLCDKDQSENCVENLENDKIRFQHDFLALKDYKDPEADEANVNWATLTLVGTGLNFDFEDLEIRWDWSDNLGAQALIVNISTPVPEPGTLLLLGSGLLGMAFYGRRRKNRLTRGHL